MCRQHLGTVRYIGPETIQLQLGRLKKLIGPYPLDYYHSSFTLCKPVLIVFWVCSANRKYVGCNRNPDACARCRCYIDGE